LLNFFIKKNIFLIKNKPLRRFQSKFINSTRTRYTLTKKILSHKVHFFNYLNYVKGPNYQWGSTGRVVKNYKPFLKSYNGKKIPWALSFLHGYFFNISYKKIIRRNLIAATRMQNFLERMKVSNFLIKNYIVWKKKKKDVRILKRDMFFNNNFVVQAQKRIKKHLLLKKFNDFKIKNKNFNKLKIKKLFMNYLLKNSKYDLDLKKILFNNQYFFNEKENLYMNKYGFFKNSVKTGVVYYIRRKFKKNVFNDVFLKKKNIIIDLHVKKLDFFKQYYLKINVLNKILSSKFFKNDNIILEKQTFTSFQKRLVIGVINNPFDYILNNFLFFFFLPKYDFLAKKKVKIAVNVNSYLSPKFLLSNANSYFNAIKKDFKLLIFLKFYVKLLTISNILKKKIFMYKNELNIFLFRSYWSLEFFKVFYSFKFRRLNFEKLFKKGRNNVALSNYKKIKNKQINKIKNKQINKTWKFCDIFLKKKKKVNW